MESATLWMPPLYLLTLGSSFYFWEPSLAGARLLSSSFGILASGVLSFWLSRLVSRSGIGSVWYFVPILLLTDVLFTKVVHTSRMESLCALSGILGIVATYYRKSFLAGLLLGLSFLSHPFGAFYGLPTLYLVWDRSYKYVGAAEVNIAKFGGSRLWNGLGPLAIGGILPLLAWGFYLVPHWDLFSIQFGAQLARKKELFETFVGVDKIRILLSGYYLPTLKGVLFVGFLGTAVFQYRVSQEKNLFRFLWVWFFAMALGFYYSTETWYVVHMGFPLAGIFYLTAISFSDGWKRYLYLVIFVGYQILALAWFQWSLALGDRAHEKTQQYMELVERIVKPYNTIYLQAIPDPYFHLREVYPDKKFYEFIPGELPIPEEFYRAAVESVDLFLFFDDRLASSQLRQRIQDQSRYRRQEWEVDYRSKVPGKGPWKIIAYEKLP